MLLALERHPEPRDAWSRITDDLAPNDYRSFCAFVENTDPGAGTDPHKLEALRATWAMRHGGRARWPSVPTSPAKRRQPWAPLWMRLLFALIIAYGGYVAVQSGTGDPLLTPLLLFCIILFVLCPISTEVEP